MIVENRTAALDHPGSLADPAVPVAGIARDSDGPEHFPRHRHFRAQLAHAIEGVMTVITDVGTWVVPPGQAVWLPAGVEHEIRSPGRLSMRSIYVHPDWARAFPDGCRVVSVSPLLRELLVRAARWDPDAALDARRRRLVEVILDELGDLDAAPLHLPLPADTRLRGVTEALLADPGDGRGLEAWGERVGASARTLSRLFVAETGMSFSAWRRRLRLVEAVSRLGDGQPVTRVAFDLGYQSPSAFVAMFRRALGAPPSRFLRGAA